jgi:hypothetical protein
MLKCIDMDVTMIDRALVLRDDFLDGTSPTVVIVVVVVGLLI